MRNDPVAEWQRLTQHYRTLTDDQLEELAVDFGDLTETAQQILRGEMLTRGLRDPQSPPELRTRAELPPAWEQEGSAGPEQDDAGDAPPHEYTWKTLLCECDTREEAWQLSEVLRRAGIESWIEGPSMYLPHPDLDFATPRVLVAADQLDEAQLIISRPIPQDVIDASRLTLPEFELPHCPGCGAPDPVLEDADPVNAWRCALCGRQWSDGEPVQTRT
ncbi:MAG TPA: hypothetical protein VL991_00105 [Terracidiphilus sp.]|jgi:hypothetical protein|nr:hypothetical protein [Terracidiphilus sp.]